jgi:cation diffusion facilitator CzcD-associated flavoprotein CzcO
MTERDVTGGAFDRDAVHAKYLEERDKRLFEGRAAIQDLANDDRFASYRRDPFTAYTERDPLVQEVDVAVIGAGMAGVVAGANLRKAGLADIRLIDQAGGVGGTWYWNRYPGIMCDVESYTYMPMLEDLDYIPTRRYAFGEEIRSHLEAIAQKYDLVEPALFHTDVETSEWDEAASRWVVRSDRGDVLRARYLVMAVGILNLLKLPALPGMEEFKGRAFHTARWDYEYTGGSPDGNLTKLGDKTVGLVGVGGSGIQCVPHLAESAENLFVFQRTPSAIGVRDNRATPEDFPEGLEPGWQRTRMENFQAIMLGRPVDDDLVDDGWTHHFAPTHAYPRDPAWDDAEYGRRLEAFDYEVMEEHRDRIDELVADAETAERLKPYYRYICKRPLFHDEYLPSLNNPNVTLVDCPRGVERVTERGVIVEGQEIELDCIIYATGFEAESTPLSRRVGHDVIGRDGITLEDKWVDGGATLFGMMSRGFPNMFIMPAPGQQAVVTVNHALISELGAEFIGGTAGLLEEAGATSFEVSAQAETDWCQEILKSFRDGSAVMAACTPSRLNNEGNPQAAKPLAGSYGGGLGDYFGFKELLADWIERGDFTGLELDLGASIE